MTRKGHEGTLWGDIHVLYLVGALGYIQVCICQNSANVHLRFMNSLVCNFYLERKTKQKKTKNVNKYCTLVSDNACSTVYWYLWFALKSIKNIKIS